MKVKLFVLFFSWVLLFCLAGVGCIHRNDKGVIKSAGTLITQYYKDYATADEKLIAKHYANNFERDYFEHLVLISKIYKIEKIEIMKTNILSREPLIVELRVKECYKPEVFPPPFHVLTYILRSKNGFTWEIIDVGEPGVP